MSPLNIVRTKMPELDSVRGVAILLVLFYHGFYWSNGLVGLSVPVRRFVSATRLGWLGVHLFFVLSGFLITGILVHSRTKTHYYRG
jgi:peptidoglycan/LPS O-acetylase OafA/YrhL